MQDLKKTIQDLNKKIKHYEDTYPEIIKDNCWKCNEKIKYTELFSYCPECLECQ